MRTQWFVAILLCAFSLSAMAQETPSKEVVVVCPITGMIDDGVAVLVSRAVREAAGAKALIFEVDTPGGLVGSAIEITKVIEKAPCPTVAYIKGMGAISAGALISFSCKSMIMGPETNIGAATPVTISVEGTAPTGEKEVSFMRAKMRALAEHNGYNPAIAEAMVDKDIELRMRQHPNGIQEIFSVYREPKTSLGEVAEKVITDPDVFWKNLLKKQIAPEPEVNKSPLEPVKTETTHEQDVAGTNVIKPSGKLLTLTPTEAKQYGLIKDTVLSRSQVLGLYGWGEARVHEIEMTWSEALFRWLRNPLVAGLLLMFGVAGIYIELKTPGVSFPGVFGGICLALFFGAHFVIGASDWIGIVLGIAGIVLIATELFFLPGTMAIGAAGILCLLAGILFLLTNGKLPEYSWDYVYWNNAFITLTVAAISSWIVVLIARRFLPMTPLYGAFVQTMAQQASEGYTIQTSEEENAVLGLCGEAVSMLRPAGRGKFGGKLYPVMTRGEFLDAGAKIRIIHVDGNRYIVAKQGDETES